MYQYNAYYTITLLKSQQPPAKANFATVSMQTLEKQNQIEFVSRKERMEKGDGFENNNNYLLYF